MEPRQSIDSSAQPMATESQRSIHSDAHVVAGHGGRTEAELERAYASDDSVEADLCIDFWRGIVARGRSLHLRVGGNGQSDAGERERSPRRAKTH
jgi:hypothetical protein